MKKSVIAAVVAVLVVVAAAAGAFVLMSQPRLAVSEVKIGALVPLTCLLQHMAHTHWTG